MVYRTFSSIHRVCIYLSCTFENVPDKQSWIKFYFSVVIFLTSYISLASEYTKNTWCYWLYKYKIYGHNTVHMHYCTVHHTII